MARTQASDYDQRREAILDHAAELFARKGFNGASIAELAAACKTSKSLIYHYYPSKEDILYEVMASHVEALAEMVETLEKGSGSPRAQLDELIGRFIALYMGAKSRQKVLLDELEYLPDARREAIVGQQRQLVAAVSKLLADIHPALANDKKQLTAVTMLLFGMINWTKNWFHADGAISPQQLAKLATTIMLDGVGGLDVASLKTGVPNPRMRQI
ncbi:MAG: TetR/AcrR family transcriptional regulator [Hyphomicrobiales bacterium]|nr:TetR/AcrR family transcriptional regulator [Hyphomicrobiales bacterium]MDE2113532.1 TetR family transcriptional regulator [Hyphomicrobiales bacterium]